MSRKPLQTKAESVASLLAVVISAAYHGAEKDGAGNGVATAPAPDRTALDERGSG